MIKCHEDIEIFLGKEIEYGVSAYKWNCAVSGQIEIGVGVDLENHISVRNVN